MLDKFTWRHLASFGLALSVILCASTIFYASQSTRQQRYLHTQYENQLSVLVNSLNQLETSLEKTRINAVGQISTKAQTATQ